MPGDLRALFRGHGDALRSHRGWDLGALAVARVLAAETGAELVFTETSRLVVDANRSLTHPRLHAAWLRALPKAQKAAIVDAHWRPHRRAVDEALARAMHRGPVVHVAVHSFTPDLDGEKRHADIGLLYDPGRTWERRLALGWQASFDPRAFRVRRNYPYRGVADGLPTSLRERWPDTMYAGLELELNQALVRGPAGVRAVAAACAPFLVEVQQGGHRAVPSERTDAP